MRLEILQFLWTVTGLFHSSRFSTFPPRCLGRTAKIMEVLGENWGTKTFLMYCEVVMER